MQASPASADIRTTCVIDDQNLSLRLDLRFPENALFASDGTGGTIQIKHEGAPSKLLIEKKNVTPFGWTEESVIVYVILEQHKFGLTMTLPRSVPRGKARVGKYGTGKMAGTVTCR